MKNIVLLIGIFFLLTTFSFSFKAQDSRDKIPKWYLPGVFFTQQQINQFVAGRDYSNDELVIEVDPLKFVSVMGFETNFRENKLDNGQINNSTTRLKARFGYLSQYLSIDFKEIAQMVNESLKKINDINYSVNLKQNSITGTIPGISEGTCGRVFARFVISPSPKNNFIVWSKITDAFLNLDLAKVKIATQDAINSINPDGLIINRSKDFKVSNSFIDQSFPKYWQTGDDITRVAIVDTFGDHGKKVVSIIKSSSNNTSKVSVQNYGGCDNRGKCDSIKVAESICASAFLNSDRKINSDIINLSLGSPIPSFIIIGAISSAISANVAVLASGGNTGGEHSVPNAPKDSSIFPAGFTTSNYGLIAVGAVDNNDYYAKFATAQKYIDLSAPGVFGSESGIFQGTSFSSAYATGILAKMIYDLRRSKQQYDPNFLKLKLKEKAMSYPVKYCPRPNSCGVGVLHKP